METEPICGQCGVTILITEKDNGEIVFLCDCTPEFAPPWEDY